MSELKKREWHSDKRAFEDHPKPCGHKRDSWICAQCADKQINFSEAEVARLKVEIEALITRLEAAEIIVKMEDVPCRLDDSGDCQVHFMSNPCEYKVWRNMAGK